MIYILLIYILNNFFKKNLKKKMKELNRFSEHFRIDQYLRNRSTKNVKSKSLIKHENILSNFPVGLIIITKEDLKFEDKI